LGCQEEFGGDQVFEGAAYAFEDGDFLRAASSLSGSTDEFVKIGGDVIAGDGTFLQGNHQLSHFGQGCAVGVDHDARVLDGVRVDFASLGAKSSNQIQMSPGTEVAAVEQWSGVRGAGAEHVGLCGAGAGVGRGDGDAVQLAGKVSDKFGGAGRVASADEDALKISREWKHGEMSAGEASGAENT